jgi:hypothetical protein
MRAGDRRYARVLVDMARGRDIVFEASRAFNLVGAEGFLWFRKRPGGAIDDDQGRAEFIEWLKGASEKEIKRFVDAAPDYRLALADQFASDPPPRGPTEYPGLLEGDSGSIAWRAIQKLAGFRAGTPRGRGGRPPAADWPAIEEALEHEIAAVGFPHENAEEGWRTNADVVKWVEARLGESEPGKTALKDNVGKMLVRIRARGAGR